MLEDAIGVASTLERATAFADPSGVDGEESAQLSQQILDALVDEHGRESYDGNVRAWLQKRRGGACGVTTGRARDPEPPSDERAPPRSRTTPKLGTN